jgi:RNA polymerase sigma factor (sigma-70 family)
MKTANLSDLVVQLGRRSALPGPLDAELLGRFLIDRDEEAFALIVRRHGPLVLGVCRRVTGNHHLAEDAFQAVFLVLAAKAGSIRPPSGLPAWLYGVAYRIALRARTMSDRRRHHEIPVETVPESASSVVDEAEGADLVAALDEEIARLPEYQRVPVVVCELEGRSRHEAAAQLGISEGTLSSRLARARRALADRLRRRGIALSAAGLTAAFAQLACASVPGGLVSKAVACAIGPGPIPAAVAALSHGVLRVMFIQKLKVMVVSGILASALFATERLFADPPTAPNPTLSAEPVSPRPDQPPQKPAEKLPAQGPNKLLFFRNGHLFLIDPDGKNEKRVTETADRDTYYSQASLSPDGKTIAILVTDLKSATELPGGDGPSVGVVFKQKLYARGLDEKEPGTDLGVECTASVWSPDGTEIACCNATGEGVNHVVVNVKTKAKKPLKVPEGHYLTDWSRDGKLFLTNRFLGDQKKPLRDREALMYLLNRDGTEHKALTDEKQFCELGRLSPDGTRVLYHRLTPPKEGEEFLKRELAVLDVTSGKSVLVGDTPLNGEILFYSWSPDGKRIAYSWRQLHEGKREDLENKETESHLVVCDPNGKNAKTIASEKGNSPWAFTIGRVDWR